jgi:hypothetical protein
MIPANILRASPPTAQESLTLQGASMIDGNALNKDVNTSVATVGEFNVT